MREYGRFSAGHIIAVGKAADTVIAPFREGRQSITFTFADNSASVITIGNQILGAVGDPNGNIVLSIGANPSPPAITLTREIHGDLVERDWHAWNQTATCWIGVIESWNEVERHA